MGTPLLVTLGLALALAVFAGGWAARFLLRVAETRKPASRDAANDR